MKEKVKRKEGLNKLVKKLKNSSVRSLQKRKTFQKMMKTNHRKQKYPYVAFFKISQRNI